MKKYIIIAGVNGAGKSTLYQMYDEFKEMPRVNVDELVRDIGDWKNARDVFTAGKIAVKNISKYLEAGVTFNQETTLCGNSIIRNILKAKEKGYFIELHYVGVESAEIAVAKRMIQLLQERVKVGYEFIGNKCKRRMGILQ